MPCRTFVYLNIFYVLLIRFIILRMSENRPFKSGARDFRDQFKSVAEFKAAIARQPKVPSLIPQRQNCRRNQGLNKAPTYFKNPTFPPRRRAGYNHGKSNTLGI